jgi:hypothetical protein
MSGDKQHFRFPEGFWYVRTSGHGHQAHHLPMYALTDGVLHVQMIDQKRPPRLPARNFRT